MVIRIFLCSLWHSLSLFWFQLTESVGLVNYTVTGFLPPGVLCPGSHPAGKCGPQQTQIPKSPLVPSWRQAVGAGRRLGWGEVRAAPTQRCLRPSSRDSPGFWKLLPQAFEMTFSENLAVSRPRVLLSSLLFLLTLPIPVMSVYYSSRVSFLFSAGTQTSQETLWILWGVLLN